MAKKKLNESVPADEQETNIASNNVEAVSNVEDKAIADAQKEQLAIKEEQVEKEVDNGQTSKQKLGTRLEMADFSPDRENPTANQAVNFNELTQEEQFAVYQRNLEAQANMATVSKKKERSKKAGIICLVLGIILFGITVWWQICNITCLFDANAFQDGRYIGPTWGIIALIISIPVSLVANILTLVFLSFSNVCVDKKVKTISKIVYILSIISIILVLIWIVIIMLAGAGFFRVD